MAKSRLSIDLDDRWNVLSLDNRPPTVKCAGRSLFFTDRLDFFMILTAKALFDRGMR